MHAGMPRHQGDLGGDHAALAHLADQNQVAVPGLVGDGLAKEVDAIERDKFRFGDMPPDPLVRLAHIHHQRALGNQLPRLVRGNIVKGHACLIIIFNHIAPSFYSSSPAIWASCSCCSRNSVPNNVAPTTYSSPIKLISRNPSSSISRKSSVIRWY